MSRLDTVNLATWDDFLEHRSSALSLLAANILPLLGVLLWGWSTFAIVLVYWAENVVIGLINILKMVCCAGTSEVPSNVPLQHAAKLFFVPFFTVHYGMFCLVHGVFVFVLLGGEDGFGGPLGNWGERLGLILETGTLWGILALAASHLYSFVKNYLIGGEYQTVGVQDLMMQPYGRIVVLHIAILFGAFATLALGSPIWLLMILIVGKTSLDLQLHLREHSKTSTHKGDQSHHDQNRGNDGFGAGAQ